MGFAMLKRHLKRYEITSQEPIKKPVKSTKKAKKEGDK
jgi:hypothetical protein